MPPLTAVFRCRLFRHDPETNTTTVLMSGINFANGVALNSQQTALLVAETGSFRVHRQVVPGPGGLIQFYMIAFLPDILVLVYFSDGRKKSRGKFM